MNILLELNSLIKFLKYSNYFKYFKNLTILVLPFGCTDSVLVGPSGLEPPTSCLSGTRSNHLSYEPLSGEGPVSGGGDDGIRTHDPLLAGQVLSQLSYTPIF